MLWSEDLEKSLGKSPPFMDDGKDERFDDGYSRLDCLSLSPDHLGARSTPGPTT